MYPPEPSSVLRLEKAVLMEFIKLWNHNVQSSNSSSPFYNCSTSFDMSNPHFPDLESYVNTHLAGSLYALKDMNYIDCPVFSRCSINIIQVKFPWVIIFPFNCSEAGFLLWQSFSFCSLCESISSHHKSDAMFSQRIIVPRMWNQNGSLTLSDRRPFQYLFH